MPMTAVPGTSAGGIFGVPGRTPEGQFTSLIYGYIREEAYDEAVRILTVELQNFPRSRAALSLLGYCYYQMQDFRSSAQCYEELVRFYPDVDSYRVYYAQCLYKAGLYPEATKACQRADSGQFAQRVLQLQAAIAYEEDDLPRSRALLDACVPDDPDTLVNHACLTYKEGKYEEARAKFAEALGALGYHADLAYNIALCHYCLKQYGAARKHIDEIIERGVREHPELSVGSSTGGAEVRSVGNTQTLRETALVEAFNLKAAIDFNLKTLDAAREALSDMPPRDESELDPVTLHNVALMGMETDPTAGFRKLNFLLTNPPFPPETFGNLLLLYLKHGCYDLAADVMAENTHLTYRHLSPELYEFLDASIMTATSPEEAYRKYDILAAKHIEALRKHTKAIQDARLARDTEGIKASLTLYDAALERYIPVLMGMARIYWERENYAQVEKIFRQAAEFASEHDTWKLNAAHVSFMQDGGKYREAIRYYEPLVKKHWDSLLDVTAIVLANLCVAYIMTSQNEEAEEIMRRIEREEERLAVDKPGKPVFHLCIVNLVIGTLYCSKGNYDFGISRVIKSLEPFDKKLGLDTWYYAKRCFVGYAEGVAKGMLTGKDATLAEILAFLDAADRYGAAIPTTVANAASGSSGGGNGGGGGGAVGGGGGGGGPPLSASDVDSGKHTVRHEARVLKRMFLKLRDG